MKKIMTLAAIFAAVMMGFSACQPEDQPSTPGTEDTPGTNDETPGTNDETPAATVTIDGEFADWDALDDAVVASCECADGTKYTGLLAMKVYADDEYVNVYFEFNDDEIVDRKWTTLQLYINADNSDETGGYGDEFADANAEWLLQGAFLAGESAETSEFISCGLALFKWWGEVGGSGWNWTDPSVEHTSDDKWGAVLGEDSGVAVGAGKDNKYELQITKEMCAGVEWADTFTIGLDIQEDWATKGVLPNVPTSDDNPNGLAPKLEVTVVK